MCESVAMQDIMLVATAIFTVPILFGWIAAMYTHPGVRPEWVHSLLRSR